APTVAGLAAWIERSTRAGEPVPPARRAAPPEPPPLSFAQERLWFLDRLEPGNPAYNLPGAVRLRGSGRLDPAALAAALCEVVRRHEPLRTTYPETAGHPEPRIAPGLELALPLIDLSRLPALEREPEWRRLAGEEARLPFDLALGPLIRTALVLLSPETSGSEHLLILNLHHIAADGWSMGVLVREITTLYEAFSAGRPSPLPPLALRYSEYALWQREQLAGGGLAADLAYWREALAGAPAGLDLPADQPRPAIRGTRGGSRPLLLPAELAAALPKLARSQGVTLFMTLLAGFGALLARLSGQEDLVVGTPIANRNRLESEPLVGLLVNTLALRLDLSGDPSFGDILGRARETTFGAYAHEDLPFEKLVEELAPVRDSGRTPFFQVMLSLQNAPLPSLTLPGLTVEPVELASGAAKFDLTLDLVETGGGIAGALEYSADLFTAATVDRLAAHLLELLAGATAAPECRLWDLLLLSGAERAELLAAGDRTADGARSGGLLHEAFFEQARHRPEAVAVEWEGGRLSYGELAARVVRLAERLRRQGVGPEVPVGVLAERGVETLVAMLGTWRAGGVFLPLDPAWPETRLDLVLADCRPALVLNAEADFEGLAGGDNERLSRPEGAQPGNLAYVIYTSGSTGRPKGVGVPHGAAVAHFQIMQEDLGLTPGDRVLQFAFWTFDASLDQVLPALGSGATLVLRGREPWSPGEVLARIAERGITVANPTPAYWVQWMGDFAAGRETLAGLPLRRVLVGAEAMPRAPLGAWRASPLAGVRLVNAYGPTEAIVTATCYAVADDPRADTASPTLPIGRPLPGRSAHVLDRGGNLAPLGVPGELCLGGRLARGYLGRPDLTAERFVPDPFAAEAGTRLYRTGDLVRLLPAGVLEFLGRVDHQVKVRGFRIELGEIEAVLAGHPRVREAVVAAREDDLGRQLVAYVVPQGSELADRAVPVFRAYLEAKLPVYMVPGAFVFLPSLPRTTSGKVDRGLLPAPERGSGRLGYTAPRDPLEELLAGIWAGVLGVERIGVDDNFFELGGHSLLATQIVARVRQVCGVELPLRQFFEQPTVAALAARIAAARFAGRRAGVPPIRPTSRARRKAELPLSFSQQRLWFLEQLEPGTAFYNIPVAVRAEGPLAIPILARTLAEVVRRQEALRTTFGESEGRPFQRIGPVPARVLALVDLSPLPARSGEAELDRLVALEARRPFDLARGPLLRSTLLRRAGDDHVLLFTLHHIVSDGWSDGILMREVEALYSAFSAGHPSPLPELPVQYADFAVWQRDWLQGKALAGQLGYWRRQLQGITGLELPLDRPRPPAETFRGAFHEIELAADLGAGLQDLARRQGATLFMVLLGAFQALLGRLTHQMDVPVGSPIANRNLPELEEIVGFFANTLVLRTDLSGDPGFDALLERVRTVTLDAYAHQDLPFEKLVEEVQPERDMSRNPLFQVMCVLQNQPRPVLDLGGLALRPLQVDSATAKFDLTIFWQTLAGRLHGLLEFNTDLFDATTALRLARHYEALLRAVVADPGQTLRALPLLDPAERQQILIEWNETALPGIGERCVHHWVEEQVERTPEEVAATFADRRLTYRELNESANRLSHGLRRRGVGPETLVGICVERSLEMVVALLAVLKAGGAAVALDPAYPKDRLAFIIRDARLRVLLTEASLAEHFPGQEAIRLLVEEGVDLFPGESSENPESGVTLDSPIYAIYTSGSTGQPKGILVTHRAFANLLGWQLGHSHLAGRARTVQFSTFGFCVSFQEIFSSWCSGGSLVLASEMTRRDILGLNAFLESERIERLYLPFAALKHLAEVAAAQERLPGDLNQVITAGEQLQVNPAVRGLFARLPGCSLHNQYGASETHVITALTLTGSAADWPAIPSVGRPIVNVRIYLLDADLQPAPIGVPGELYAAGACVARCYLNDPVLTAQKMVPDPYSAEPGARLYRTGDSARYLAGGRIEYHGRIDTQVKIRGFRVELGEIDTVLASHPAVRDAAVVAQAAGAEGRKLVAYVVLEEGGERVIEELRNFLKQKLPEYMLPTAFVAMPALPINANGKLDQPALPVPDLSRRDRGAATPPRTPIERALAEIWGEVLGIEVAGIGVEDNFFELGGHSLLATQVVSRVRSTLTVDLPIRRLFETPSIAGLAARIEELPHSVPAPEPSPTSGPEGEPPLSFAQERLWFLDRLTPGTPTYNMPASMRLRGSLDREVLARSFGEIVRRHEILRTRFALVASSPVQVIDPPRPAALPLVDLTALPAAVRGLEGERLTTEEAERSFDLERGPLFRLILVRLDVPSSDGEHLLLLTMHHIVSDGWSMGILLHELQALYEAFTAGRPSPLPELPLQYAGFARDQRERLRGAALEAQLGYWRDRLGGGTPALDLPTDRPRPPVQTYRGASELLTLPPSLADGLRALSRREGGSLFMTLLAGFTLLLSRLAGQQDLAVGMPIAGRNRREIEGLIGFFLNTLVLRTELSADLTFSELLGRVREAALGGFANQDVPFEKLLEDLRPERDLSRTPFFQAFFNLLNFPMSEVRLPGLTLEPLALPEGGSKFDLTVYAVEEKAGIELRLVYNADLFDPARITEMLRQYRGILAQAVATPAARIADLSLLTDTAAALLPNPMAPLGETWRGAVHELFERQAARRPERTALSDRQGSWSYGELDQASGRLAAHLVAQGVRRGDRVAIYAHRSAPIVWAVLGTLRAGAAFVILDPAYPAPRLLAMLDLAAPRAWLGLAAAGSPPAEVAAWAARLPEGCRLDLPGGGPGAALALLPEPDPAIQVEVGPDDLAYLAFTSGSTGMPKGVMGRHGPLSHFLPWQCERFGFGESDRFSLLSGLAHDPLQRDIFTPLYLGAAICVPDVEEIVTPGRLAAWMARERVSVSHLTPAMGQLLTESSAGTPSTPISSLRYVLLVGDILTRLDVARLRRLAPGVTCVNLYGSTETQRAVGYHEVESPGYEADGERGPQVLPLGRGMEDVQLLVLDPAGRLAGIGEVGEICLRSPHLAAGYFGDEAHTAEKFRANPFTGRAGDRLYRTGDLGRYLPNGEVAFAGRADQQVKIRGFRIELGEIEAQLGLLPGVQEAVVLARDEPATGKQLVAYVVPDRERPASVVELRDVLRQRLPVYMVPGAFVLLEAMPITPNGKVDRRALARLKAVRERETAGHVAPETALEQAIAAVWREVLQLENVSVEDNFFDLGGHSLLLIRLHGRLQEVLARELSVVDLFTYSNIRALAAHLAHREEPPAALAETRNRAQKQIEAGRRQKDLAKARRGKS
ncbi:MAG: hypothetical protein QOJ16_2232, partial [Acidobacteriota bacterium]|nr:hypothetical protein [Acidobacteriota bacterium]